MTSNAATSSHADTVANTAAIITGGSRGIGAAIAKALASQGVAVGLIARDAEMLDFVASSIREAGGSAFASVADVTDYGAVVAAVDQLATSLGAPISLLVNNAGRIDREVPLWQADPAEWREVVDTNLTGSFHTSRTVVPRMLAAGGGRVVEIVSGAGAKDWDRASAYVATKAAMLRNVAHLHEAGFEQGLRAFGVAPGTVRTDMTRAMEAHKNRSDFTPVELTTEMVLAIHRGQLDGWSGKYLRVTHDTPQSLMQFERDHGAPAAHARRLAIVPRDDHDPLFVG